LILGNVLSNQESSLDLLTFLVHSPVELHVYDSNGKHVGLGVSGELERGFIADCYTIEGIQVVTIPEPKDDFNVELIGTGNGQYNLTAVTVTGDVLRKDSYVGEVERGEIIQFNLNPQETQLHMGHTSSFSSDLLILSIVGIGLVVFISLSIIIFKKRKMTKAGNSH